MLKHYERWEVTEFTTTYNVSICFIIPRFYRPQFNFHRPACLCELYLAKCSSWELSPHRTEIFQRTTFLVVCVVWMLHSVYSSNFLSLDSNSCLMKLRKKVQIVGDFFVISIYSWPTFMHYFFLILESLKAISFLIISYNPQALDSISTFAIRVIWF